MTFVKGERSMYHSWRHKAREHPDQYMVIILDGMDQSKTNILDHNTSESHPSLTVRVIGAFSYEIFKVPFRFFLLEMFQFVPKSIYISIWRERV